MGRSLRTILDAATALLAADLGPIARAHVQRIHAAAETLSGMVEGGPIRGASLTPGGGATAAPIHSLLDALAVEQAEVAQAHGNELVLHVDASVSSDLVGDPGSIRESAMNLVRHAIESAQKGREIVLRVSAGGARGTELLLDVRALVDGATIASTTWELRVGAPVEARGGLLGGRALVALSTPLRRAAAVETLQSLGVEAHAIATDQGVHALELATRAGEPFTVALFDLPDRAREQELRTLFQGPALSRVRLVLAAPPGHAEDVSKLVIARPIRRESLRRAITEGSRSIATQAPVARGSTAPVTSPLPPARPSASAVSPPPSLRSQPSATGSVRSAPGSIQDRPLALVVEDDVVNQKVAAFLLEKRGYRVSVAGDGEQAVEAVLGGNFGIVLMDCAMPKCDGYAATRRIREGEIGRRTPIVAMTAHSGPGAREQCLEAGMDDYLTKPILPDLLDAALRRWCPVRPASTPSNPGNFARPPMVAYSPPSSPVTVRPTVPEAPPTAPTALAPPAAPASRPTRAEDVLDPSAIATLKSLEDPDDPGVVKQIVDLFARDAPKAVQGILEGLAANDPKRIERFAHTLKGSSGNVGARALQRLCARIEAHGRAGETEPVGSLTAELEYEAERAVAALMLVV